MAGVAANLVGEILTQETTWATQILEAAKSALANLGALELPTSYGTNYGAVSFETNNVDAAPLPGDIAVGVAPDIVSIVVPTKPDKPSIPTVTLGAIRDITLPELPTISFPTLDITAPVYNVTAPKEWSFNINNILISDDPLVQACIQKLTSNIVNGGTGLSETVETAIWNRDLERNEQTLQDSTDKAVQVWAKTGFSLPDGMLAHSIAELQKEYMNRSIDRSREISIKQAELEQSNLFKSLDLSINLFSQLIGMLIKYEELCLRAQEDTAKYANEYIDMQIKAYAAKVDAYRATAQVHEMIIRAEISKVELYKAQIEGQKLIGDINQQTVQIYSEQLKATAILIDRYRVEVQAMVSEMEVEKAKVEANKLQFDAWAKKTDVVLAKYAGEVDLYKAASMINVSAAELYSKQAEAEARVNIAYAEMKMKSFAAADNANIEKAKMVMEAERGVAAAAASMASGAMAALSAQASMSYSESQQVE